MLMHFDRIVWRQAFFPVVLPHSEMLPNKVLLFRGKRRRRSVGSIDVSDLDCIALGWSGSAGTRSGEGDGI